MKRIRSKDGHFHPAGKGIFVFLAMEQGQTLRVWGKKSSSLRCGIFYPPKPCTI
jgi:hypothetical protein